MTELTDRNCFTCGFALHCDGDYATDTEPAEEGMYLCTIGGFGALEHEALTMPECDDYVLDPELTQ